MIDYDNIPSNWVVVVNSRFFQLLQEAKQVVGSDWPRRINGRDLWIIDDAQDGAHFMPRESMIKDYAAFFLRQTEDLDALIDSMRGGR